MSRPSVVAPADSWTEVLELFGKQGTTNGLLSRLLEGARASCGASGAAVYLEDEGGLARQVAVGAGEFPTRLSAASEPQLQRLELAGGEVAFAGGSGQLAIGGELALALAAAVRAAQLEKKLKAKRFEINYRGVELEALYDVGLAIASTLNLDELSEEILLRAVSLLDARRGALYSVSAQGYELTRALGGTARESASFDEPIVQRLLAREPVGEQDLLPGAEHLLAVPIEVDDQPRGLLVMGDKESRHGVGPFASSDLRTLSLFANQAAIALENAYLHRQALEKERLEREAELAADIQRRLLPAQLPEVEGLEVSGWSRPARHVGGDYYDVFPLDSGRLATVVADVSGKGMPAALMVSTLHSALHLLIEGAPLSPQLLERVNHHVLAASAPNKFITLMAAEIDPVTGEVNYLNAGHNPSLLIAADGATRELPSGGFPLGMFPDARYEARRVTLAPGDLLCFFSDGITEAAAPNEEEFGPARLTDVLRAHAEAPLPEIVTAVEQATTRFADGMAQADDQTLVLLRKS